MGRKFVNRLRTFPLFLTNIYELIHEHLRTPRFVYELWGSFTNLRFRLRTLGFIYELARSVYELWVLLRKFVNRLRTFPLFLTNIYELSYEYLRTLHFVYELFGFHLRTCGFVYELCRFHLRTCVFRLRTLGFTSKVRKRFTNIFFSFTNFL